MNNPIPEHALDIEVLKQFRVIFKSVRSHFQSIERSCGVSGAQLWALAKIEQLADVTVTVLAKELAIHQTTASNLVEKLVARRLISKGKLATDQRFVSLNISEKGRAVLAKAPMPLQGLLPDALGKMPYKKLIALHQLLEDLQKLMAHIDDDAGASPLSDADT